MPVEIDRARFRAWLAARPRRELFERCSPVGCPLGVYWGFPVEGDIFYAEDGVPHPLDRWAQEYIFLVDYAWYWGRTRKITARKALAILDAIPQS